MKLLLFYFYKELSLDLDIFSMLFLI